jgi:hypothetical protein
MGAWEDWIKWMEELPPAEREKVERDIKDQCDRAHISNEASHLHHRGYLKEDYNALNVARTDLFSKGDHYVYIWRHMNGDPFYVGSGKNNRSRSISANRPDRFYGELMALDAVLCYIAADISEKDARFIERYCSFFLSSNGVNLTNSDGVVRRMSSVLVAKKEKEYAANGEKSAVIKKRLDFLMSKKYKPDEHYGEIVTRLWKEYGTLFCLKFNGNFERGWEALSSETPTSN